jgi:hypothetical protein
MPREITETARTYVTAGYDAETRVLRMSATRIVDDARHFWPVKLEDVADETTAVKHVQQFAGIYGVLLGEVNR